MIKVYKIMKEKEVVNREGLFIFLSDFILLHQA